MMNSRLKDEIPSIDDYTLVDTRLHDTISITPLHVTVIESLAAVIGVNPTEQSLELSDHVCIEALDAVCQNRAGTGDANSVVSFGYPCDSGELLVVARCDGEVMVFEDE